MTDVAGPRLPHAPTVTTAPAVTREQSLWDQEVARVLEAASTFASPARAAVLGVLTSLADDPTETLETRQDVRALLVEVGEILHVAAEPDEGHLQEPDAVRSLLKRTLSRVDSRRGRDERIRVPNPIVYPARIPTVG